MIEIVFKDRLIEQYFKTLTKDKSIEVILKNVDDKSLYTKKFEKITEKEIKHLLLELKFNLSSKRIKYLIDAIMLTLDNPSLMENLNNIYEIIGIKYNQNKDTIKWSIIGIIDGINKRLTTDQLHSIFYIYDNEKVCPKHFFTMIYQYFNSEK